MRTAAPSSPLPRSALTDRYAVIGNPIAHSKSPVIHAAFARATGQDMDYSGSSRRSTLSPRSVAAFRAAGGRGLNVTLPFKDEAFRLATELSDRARAVEAVNTLRFEGTRILGDNTDGVGLVRDIGEPWASPSTAAACCCSAPAGRRGA